MNGQYKLDKKGIHFCFLFLLFFLNLNENLDFLFTKCPEEISRVRERRVIIMCIISNILKIYSDDVRDTNSVLIQVRGIQI